jgi:UDP-N-acetylmuramyl pentapeptide phosphotransferase/UDP-N-acetylglucosamine-1-phosphate transferase
VLLSVCAAAILSATACGALIAFGPKDNPSEARKAHQAPTPTSGGLGVALGLTIGAALVWTFSGEFAGREALTASILGLSVALLFVGFADDTLHLSAALKFAIFSGLALLGVQAAGAAENIPLAPAIRVQLPAIVAIVGSALWIFTLINCVNFMDGANGLAMGSMAIGFVGLAVLGQVLGAPVVFVLALLCVGALLGFLMWNFPSGKIFAGDSGALFVAGLAAMLSLLLVAHYEVSVFVPPILFFPLLADALLTLQWRVQRRRKLLLGHSEHLYQIAMRAWPGHWRAALAYWVAMAACAGLAVFVAQEPDVAAGWIALGSLALISITISAFMRSWALQRGYLEP